MSAGAAARPRGGRVAALGGGGGGRGGPGGPRGGGGGRGRRGRRRAATAREVALSRAVAASKSCWATSRYSRSITNICECFTERSSGRRPGTYAAVASVTSATFAIGDLASCVRAIVKAPDAAASASMCTVSAVWPVLEIPIATLPRPLRAAEASPSCTAVQEWALMPMR